MHVALLGDSILDNGSYTKGEPDVASHLRTLMPETRVTLCAIDGSTIADLQTQIPRVPADATDIVISVGGNDALLNSDLLATRVSSTTAALLLFRERIGPFESGYRGAIKAVLALGRKTAICTIYNGNLDPPEAEVARIALMTFNDVILRCGFEYGLSIIDLRFVCNEKSDYANPIEPSGSGGLKIAKAIAHWLHAGEQGEGACVFIA